jgi:hypothetical protein
MKKKLTKEQSVIQNIKKFCISTLAESRPKIYDSEWHGRQSSCSNILLMIKDNELKTRQPQ